MQTTIVALGSLREPHFKEAALNYERRLLAYTRLRTIEIAPERVKDEGSPAQIREALAREGQKILRLLPPRQTLVALDIKGKTMDSPGLADWLEGQMARGQGHTAFLIGGSYGLAGEILQKADLRLSFSSFTFPHQLMRIILLEQIYRAHKIMRNESYHK